MTVLKILADGFHEGGWGMWPILFLLMITISILIERAVYLRRAGGTEHDVQQAMDEEALRELPRLEKRTGYLAMLGNLATLAGLLGTITGLIKSFAGVAGVDPSMKATMLSKGISEAMNCTAFGLGTGILGLATYAWLNGMTQAVLDGVNQSSVETLNLVVAGRGGGAQGDQY